jgi:putative glycosyltransferase
MKLSIVSTLYRSAPYLAEFHQRLTAAARAVAGDDFEIVFVNDGSPDDVLDRAVKLTESDARLTVVDLSRNFGHHKAMMTGLAHARGDFVFLIDSDLEEDPEWLTGFWEQREREGCDVVYGVNEKRTGGPLHRLSGRIFYWVYRSLAGRALPENLLTARLMTRRYVDALLLHTEREPIIAGLWLSTGFDQRPHPAAKHRSSETTYHFGRKVTIFINAVTAFSDLPLHFIFHLGWVLTLLAGLGTLGLTAAQFLAATPPPAWLWALASIWLACGILTTCVGIVADLRRENLPRNEGPPAHHRPRGIRRPGRRK